MSPTGKASIVGSKKHKAPAQAALLPTPCELEKQLTESEALQVRDAFFDLDGDGDGLLDGDEFRSLLVRLDRSDLDPEAAANAVRRMGSKRKDNKIAPTDLLQLRETLRFFAQNPRPCKPESEVLAKYLFDGLLEQSGGGKGDKASSAPASAQELLSVSSISTLLREKFDLEASTVFGDEVRQPL